MLRYSAGIWEVTPDPSPHDPAGGGLDIDERPSSDFDIGPNVFGSGWGQAACYVYHEILNKYRQQRNTGRPLPEIDAQVLTCDDPVWWYTVITCAV